MLWIALQVVLGMVFGNFMEWLVHRYFLHGIGKKPKSILSFHWRGHHRYSRKNKFRDPDYDQTLFAWNGRTKEILALSFLVILFSPLAFLIPAAYAGMVLWTVIYYCLHTYSHKNPEWAKKWMRWHYEHHMGLDQDSNFNVTFPLWDHILGTRKYYAFDDRGRAKEVKNRVT